MGGCLDTLTLGSKTVLFWLMILGLFWQVRANKCSLMFDVDRDVAHVKELVKNYNDNMIIVHCVLCLVDNV